MPTSASTASARPPGSDALLDTVSPEPLDHHAAALLKPAVQAQPCAHGQRHAACPYPWLEACRNTLLRLCRIPPIDNLRR